MGYKKEGMQHYMNITCNPEWVQGYVGTLMQYHVVPYMLPFELRQMNEECELYYRLQYRTTVKAVLGHLQFNRRRVHHLIESIVGVLQMAEEYMFAPELVLWKAEYIFIEADTGKLQFCYYPDEQLDENERGNIRDFLRDVIEVMDKKDEDTMMCLLSFYHLITEPDCTLQKLRGYLMKLEAKPLKQIRENPDMVAVVAEENEMKYEKVKKRKEKKQEASISEEAEETRGEKLIKWMVVAVATINIAFIILLIANVLTYDYIRYLIGSMGVLVVITIIYMNMSKEETPDEMMQHYFENVEQTVPRYDDEKVVVHPASDEYEDDVETYGETSLLRISDMSFERQTVKEEKHGPLILSSFMKERYPTIHIDSSTVVGCMQAGCNYLLKERGISRMHAKLMRKNDGLYVLDLNSTNGTYLNGEILESGEEYILEEGDIIAFAKCEFLVGHE
ncbi:MAG: DUF6382 domain-containing protein [Eubacteriales bacterium]|nr:DUF6382 domain-containing protein [Eubacteriales bacterium]